MHALSVYETDAVLKTIKTASLPYRIMCCCSMLASGWDLEAFMRCMADAETM